STGNLCFESASVALRPRKETSVVLRVLRWCGLVLALMMATGWGPQSLMTKSIAGFIWTKLAFSVGVIVPLGAMVLAVFLRYGCLEFVGTLMRPIMHPLYKLPGRAALDNLTSWIGSYAVGLYMTRSLLTDGRYSRREAFIIATCFSTVSIGFVGVVADTLELLHLFPLVFGTYFLAVYVLGIVMVRLWPVTFVPAEYVAEPRPEVAEEGPLLKIAYRRAIERATSAPAPHRVAAGGLVDGLLLAAPILGTIVAVGTGAVWLTENTPLFEWLGMPLVPVLSLLGLPDPQLLAPATLAGITEMYVPVLLVKEAALEGRFFIAVLSVSQLVFFSSVGPMMIEMFDDVPIRFRDLVGVFVIRTVFLVPLLAAVTHILAWAGAFAS
ncbi:MAG: YjiH family protein, partial [Proteobacteria bacterium]|nr:YjiH family protein [Pseudomonadota bacterium]